MTTVNSLINAEWKRKEQPIISAMLTGQQWCRVTLYSPTVVRAQGKYRMWYAGNSSATRTSDMDLGYAESQDGLEWSEYPGNPILTASQLPEGKAWQTPHVMFDEDDQLYKMWFVMADMERNPDSSIASFFQKLGYAVSERRYSLGRASDATVSQRTPSMRLEGRPRPVSHVDEFGVCRRR